MKALISVAATIAALALGARPETGTLQYVEQQPDATWNVNATATLSANKTDGGTLITHPDNMPTMPQYNDAGVLNVIVTNPVTAPAQVNNAALCPDVANKVGMVVYTAPGDAGTGCLPLLPNVTYRTYATGNVCALVGSNPATCSATAVSTGLRFAADSPEQIAWTGTPAVMADGGTPADGGTATHVNVCATATSATSVLCFTPYTRCATVP